MAIASEGLGVEKATANAAPILDVAVPRPGPTLNWEPVPDLPPELQPAPGDVLLEQAFWPWQDLGAKGIPEHWLYMSRHVQGVIAQFVVQTPVGPKLLAAQPDGTLTATVESGTVDVIDRYNRMLGRTSGVMVEAGTPNIPTTLTTVPIDVSLAAGATLDIAGSAPGVTVYLISLNLQIVTAAMAEVTVENFDGSVIFSKIRTDALMAFTRYYGGAIACGGLTGKIRLHNTSAGASGTIAGDAVFVTRAGG